MAIRVEPPVAPSCLRPVAELDQLRDRLLLARLGAAEPGLVGVDLGVAAEVVEAGVALPRALRGLRVDLVEVPTTASIEA